MPGARCKWFAYVPVDATATPSSLACFTKIRTGLTVLAPAYPGCPEKEAVKLVPVCLNYTQEATKPTDFNADIHRLECSDVLLILRAERCNCVVLNLRFIHKSFQFCWQRLFHGSNCSSTESADVKRQFWCWRLRLAYHWAQFLGGALNFLQYWLTGQAEIRFSCRWLVCFSYNTSTVSVSNIRTFKLNLNQQNLPRTHRLQTTAFLLKALHSLLLVS